MTFARGGRVRRLAAPLGLAVLVLASAPAAIAAGTSSSGAAAKATICVGVIVDYEDLQAPEPSPNSYCARVPAGSTGTEILDARATALHLPAPAFQANGLLCQIDGVPATNVCNTQNADGGFNYWAYWNRPAGAAGWTYAREGPSSYHPANGAQEGWTWVAGQSEADAPQPPVLSEAVVCPSTTTSPTPTPTPSLTATPSRSTAPSTAPPVSTSAAAPTAAMTTPAAGTSSTARRTHTSPPSSTVAPTSPDGTGSPATRATTASSSASAGAIPTDSPGSGVTHLEATASARGVRPTAATAWIAGVVLIAIIAAASWWRSKSP